MAEKRFGKNSLTGQDMVLLRSIIIKNQETMDFIDCWFDSMLDKLAELTTSDAQHASLGPMIVDIAKKSKIKHGLLRYSYKDTIVKFTVDDKTNTVVIELYLFDDKLKESLGCWNSVVWMQLGKDTTLHGIYYGTRSNKFTYNCCIKPNMKAGMSRMDVVNIITSEIVDFIAVMLYSVMKRKPATTKTVESHIVYSKKSSYTSHANDNIVVDETKKTSVYHSINRERAEHGPMKYQYVVCAHYRHYRSGAVAYIHEQVRCKDKPKKGEL